MTIQESTMIFKLAEQIPRAHSANSRFEIGKAISNMSDELKKELGEEICNSFEVAYDMISEDPEEYDLANF